VHVDAAKKTAGDKVHHIIDGVVVDIDVDSDYGWMPHNAGFDFLDIVGANVGVFASLDRL
jgi:hypothetical protein